MNVLNAEGITKSYSEKILLDNVSLGISQEDKIGIIGVNGTGKSTFLKILAGVEMPDGGKITKAKGIRIEYLSQNPDFRTGETVLENVFRGDSNGMKELREYELLVATAATVPNNYQIQDALTKATSTIDALGLWNLENEAKSILMQLGINDYNQKVETLSGGQRKRVAMAAALINPADLLILDEPTNHIDNESVQWLEKYLEKFTGALIMVTHDRYFLDRVTNRIIEIDNGHLFSYKGNYSVFLELKTLREDMELATQRKRESILRTELEWIKRGARARSTKQKARIERYEDMKTIENIKSQDNVEMATLSSRLGKKTIEISNICKSYENKNLIDHFNYIVLRDDRIGIIGNNGCGKSTLLKILAKVIEPDSGEVAIGDTVKLGFFTQENEDMNENLKIIEYVRQTAEYIDTIDGKISASQMLEKFLFPSHLQWTSISKLSGGEKRRLYLLNILMSSPNILFLDEPTNDLDIQTLTILEDYLDSFPGAVICVSHDRYFLDRVVDRIFAFNNGTIKPYEGGYTDYLDAVVNEQIRKPTDMSIKQVKPVEKIPKEKTLKFTFNEKREYEQIDGYIADLEQQIIEIDKAIGVCATDYVLLQELTEKKEGLEAELNKTMDRWMYLNDLADKIEALKK